MAKESSTPRSEGLQAPNSGRRFGVGTLVLIAIISSAAIGAGTYWLGRTAGENHAAVTPETAQAQKARYQCPMHPSIVQDHPGECPICGMKLVRVDEGKGVGAASAAVGANGERRILNYRAPMDPKVTSPTPKKDEMGMDCVPVYANDITGAQSPVAGQATVDIDPARQQLIGLTTAEVTAGPVGGSWRTVGRVAMDETRVRHINLKVPGFVERIYVDFVGKTVKRATRFSPSIVPSCFRRRRSTFWRYA